MYIPPDYQLFDDCIRPSCLRRQDSSDFFTNTLRLIRNGKKQPINATTPQQQQTDISPVIKKSIGPQQQPQPSVHQSPAAMFLANFTSSPAAEEQPLYIDKEYYFLEREIIGHGGTSTVYKAHHNSNATVLAVKVIRQSDECAEDILYQRRLLQRELTIWRSLDHRNILRLHKAVENQEDKTWYLLSDYCPRGTLLSLFKKRIHPCEIQAIFREICLGVRYLHIDRQVIHKDLKLDNILLDDTGHVKICDFGLALRMKEDKEEEEVGGSLAYVAPEQLKQAHKPVMCPKTDIWSLGVILYALSLGVLPFHDNYGLRLRNKIKEGCYTLPDNADLSEPLKEVIRGCLMYDPIERWYIDKVLNSTWLNQS